jgi:hypothetical protein
VKTNHDLARKAPSAFAKASARQAGRVKETSDQACEQADYSSIPTRIFSQVSILAMNMGYALAAK